MPPDIDYIDVPHLQDILNFLPIDPQDEADINNYVRNLAAFIAINYNYGLYQFAYFGIHLLYMTYIYCTAWKIGKMKPNRYKDAIIFARSYNGREQDLKIEEASSVFTYSLLPEKDIAKIFSIIDLDKSRISEAKSLVGSRDDIAHASGKFEIATQELFEAKVNTVLLSMNAIHNRMAIAIRDWYSQLLSDFCDGEYDYYDKAEDFIYEQLIQTYKFSVCELLICNGMSFKALIASHLNCKTKLKQFKEAFSEYCIENGYMNL